MKTLLFPMVLAVLSASGITRAQVASAPPAPTYQAIKTWHEQYLAGSPNRQGRIEALRTVVREGPLGETGMRRMFGNFEGRMAIEPSIPGVERTARLLNSQSRSQRKGHARELIYAIGLHNEGRNELVAINRRLDRAWGNTDADIVMRHRRTGLYGRMEVKDYSLRSQVINRDKLMKQMNKMELEMRATGQPQFWINRHPVTHDLKHYAARKNIVLLENVATGQRRSANTTSFRQALDRIDQSFVQTAQRSALVGKATAGLGAVWAVQSAPFAWRALGQCKSIGEANTSACREFGQYGATMLASVGMVVSGGATILRPGRSEMFQNRMHGLGRMAGIGSIAALAASEVFLIARYRAGDISSRDFWTAHWTQGMQATGAVGGTWLGAGLGVLMGGNPVASAAGGVLGGTAFGWLSGKIAERATDIYYEHRFGKLDQQFGEFVYRTYGVL